MSASKQDLNIALYMTITIDDGLSVVSFGQA